MTHSEGGGRELVINTWVDAGIVVLEREREKGKITKIS